MFSLRERYLWMISKGAHSKDDRNFSTFFYPLWTENNVIVTLYYDVIVTNTDRILPNPPPP